VQLQARGTAKTASLPGCGRRYPPSVAPIRCRLPQEAQTEVLDALRRILETEVVSTQSPPVEDAEQAMEAWRIENAQAMLAQDAAMAEEPVAEATAPVLEESTPQCHRRWPMCPWHRLCRWWRQRRRLHLRRSLLVQHWTSTTTSMRWT
jgi:hypothetical protein